MAVVIVYASLSLFWSDASFLDAMAMAYTLLLTACAFVVGRAIVVLRRPEDVSTLLWRVLIALGVITLIYCSESLLSLGLRSESTKEWTDFGIQRVRGPLFGSATGPFVIVPALALAIEEIRRGVRSRVLAYGLATAFLVTLLGLGSRGGMLTLAVFIAFLLFSRARLRTKLSLLILIGSLFPIAAAVVFSKATADRLIDFSDVSRLETHVTAWEIVKERSILVSVFGSGYGSIWPWYLPDVEDGGARATGRFFVETAHGRMLYNPHSVFLPMVVELGVVGASFFACLLCVLGKLAIKGRRRAPYAIFAFGLAASGVSLFTDMVLFKVGPLSVLWWIFLFGGLSLTHEARHRLHGHAWQRGRVSLGPTLSWGR